jgi:Cu(I)/Ag(I) efflux system membrane fusion protein
MKVVVSGQFLIDSESSLKSAVTRLSDAPRQGVHRGEGRVERVGKDAVTISHGAIASLQMGAMTMDFAVRQPLPAGVKDGAAVSFEFRQGSDGRFEIVAIKPAEARK